MEWQRQWEQDQPPTFFPLHTTPGEGATFLPFTRRETLQEEDVSTHLWASVRKWQSHANNPRCNHPASYPRDHSFLERITKWDSNMLCRLICGLSLPVERLLHKDRRHSFTSDSSSQGHNWHSECPLPDMWNEETKSIMALFFQSSAANGLSDTVMRLKLGWKIVPLNQSSLQGPISSLEPWDGEERKRWDGKETERKRRKGEGKGEQKKKRSKQNADTVQVFWYFLPTLIHMEEESGSTPQLVCVTTTGTDSVGVQLIILRNQLINKWIHKSLRVR